MSTDHLTALRSADPAAGLVPDPEVAARLDATLERILAEGPSAPPSSPARWPRRAVAVTAVAACGLGAVAVLPGSGPGPSAPGVGVPAASAATVLSHARAELLTGGGSGAWGYQREQVYTTHMYAQGRVAVVPSVSETWIGPGDELRTRTTTQGDDVVFPTAADRAAYEARPQPPLPGDGQVVTRDAVDYGGLSPADVRALPTAPDALAARMAATAGATRGLRPTALAAMLLRTPVTPPAVKAGLLTVLQRTTDAELVTGVEDPRGRVGDGVVFHDDAWDTLFLFDRASGALLGTQSIGKHEVPGRKITDWDLILESDRRDAAPPAQLEQKLTPGPGGATAVALTPVG